MKMHRAFHYTLTETRSRKDMVKVVYFVKKHPHIYLYILNIFYDGSGGLINSDPNIDETWINDDPPKVMPGDEEKEANKTREMFTRELISEGYHEISEEEFMCYVDEMFPRWRELKFNRRTKEMYYPEEEEEQL